MREKYKLVKETELDDGTVSTIEYNFDSSDLQTLIDRMLSFVVASGFTYVKALVSVDVDDSEVSSDYIEVDSVLTKL